MPLPLPPSKRARGDADMDDGINEAGSGLPITKPPNGVPHCYNNNYTVKLTYADALIHNVSYGAAQHYAFNATSIYDPDFTGVGHQPFFRDMWVSQYDYYSVIKCDYEFTFYNACSDTVTYTAVGTSGQRLGAVLVSLKPTTRIGDINATGNYVYPIAETKGVRNEVLPPEGTMKITGTLTPGDFLVDAKDSDLDETWTAVGSNPAVTRYIGYNISSLLQSSLTGQNEQAFSAIQVFVKLDYTVQFTQVNPSLRQVPS